MRQLDALARETLTGLSRNAPLSAGRGFLRVLDVDSTISRVYGYAKQGADYGYTRIRGLHPPLATISTPIAAPVIVGTRLRRGDAGSAKGAAGFVAESITTARQAGATAGAARPDGLGVRLYDETTQQWISDAESAETPTPHPSHEGNPSRSRSG